MSKNLKVKKMDDGSLKTLIITNNDKNKKFSLKNVKRIFSNLIKTNNFDEGDIQIDLQNNHRSIQIKNFNNDYDDDMIDNYYSNKIENYQISPNLMK